MYQVMHLMDIKIKLIEKDNIELILPLFYELDSSVSEPVLLETLKMKQLKGQCLCGDPAAWPSPGGDHLKGRRGDGARARSFPGRDQ